MGLGWKFIRGSIGALLLGVAISGWSNGWQFDVFFWTLDLSILNSVLPDPAGGGFNSILSGAVITIIAWAGAFILYKAARMERDEW